jgi:hypothetical protein
VIDTRYQFKGFNMRRNRVLVIITVSVVVLFSVITPVLSYQSGQNPQGTSQVEQSIQPRMLIAKYGCDGAHDARDSLNSARESLKNVSDEGVHLVRALQATDAALEEIAIQLNERCR